MCCVRSSNCVETSNSIHYCEIVQLTFLNIGIYIACVSVNTIEDCIMRSFIIVRFTKYY